MNNLEIKSCLIGMLLGDATIERTSPKSSRMRISHSIKQRNYLQWKNSILERLTGVHTYDYLARIGDKQYPMTKTTTNSIPLFSDLRNQMYFQGRKSITSHLLKALDWRGIAIWFLDDGYIEKNSAQIATNSFNEGEHLLIKKVLKERHGLHVSIGKRRQYYYLRFNVESTGKIVEWVKMLNIPGMEYKICSYEKLSPPPYKDKL